jgi:hypothetical protein
MKEIKGKGKAKLRSTQNEWNERNGSKPIHLWRRGVGHSTNPFEPFAKISIHQKEGRREGNFLEGKMTKDN